MRRTRASGGYSGSPSNHRNAFSTFLQERDSAIAPVLRRFGVNRSRSRKAGWGDELAQALTGSLREGIQECWQVLRAMELAVHEVEVEFGGEHPLLPEPRSILDGVRKELEDLRQNVQPYGEPFELPEPDAEVLGRVRGLARLAGDD